MSVIVIETSDLAKLIEDAVEVALLRKSLQIVPVEAKESTLLSIDEAAELLNVSVSTIHTYKRDGLLPFHRIGRRVYFQKSEILLGLKKIN